MPCWVVQKQTEQKPKRQQSPEWKLSLLWGWAHTCASVRCFDAQGSRKGSEHTALYCHSRVGQRAIECFLKVTKSPALEGSVVVTAVVWAVGKKTLQSHHVVKNHQCSFCCTNGTSIKLLLHENRRVGGVKWKAPSHSYQWPRVSLCSPYCTQHKGLHRSWTLFLQTHSNAAVPPDAW